MSKFWLFSFQNQNFDFFSLKFLNLSSKHGLQTERQSEGTGFESSSASVWWLFFRFCVFFLLFIRLSVWWWWWWWLRQQRCRNQATNQNIWWRHTRRRWKLSPCCSTPMLWFWPEASGRWRTSPSHHGHTSQSACKHTHTRFPELTFRNGGLVLKFDSVVTLCSPYQHLHWCVSVPAAVRGPMSAAWLSGLRGPGGPQPGVQTHHATGAAAA